MAKGPVLIVDDDDGIRESIDMTLSDEGYEVLTASHGADALTLVDHHSPSLILLDMRMPVMDGWQFARAYRQMPGPHAPIVVFTAALEAAGRAAEIHADGVLPKPFSLSELLEIVGRYVEHD
jgi:two-component system, chemotaxis family, chemotaxis protein CheY